MRDSSNPIARRTAAAALPVVLLLAALLYPGLNAAQVEVNDGGVWVTSRGDTALGRYNPTIEDLTGGLGASSPDLDVLQDGADVLLLEPGRATVVDPTNVTLTSRVDLPVDAEVALQDGTVLIVDPWTGQGWLRALGTLATLRIGEEEADLDVGVTGVLALGVDGIARGLTGDGQEIAAHIGEAGAVVVEEGPIRRPSSSGSWQQGAVVGESLVAMDGTLLSLPDRDVTLPMAAKLQTSSATGPVALAADTALLLVDLGSGTVAEHTAGAPATPAQPVQLGECVHAAWTSAENNYLSVCGNDVDFSDLEGMNGGVQPVFRVNRDRIILNDTANGSLWLPEEDMQRREPAWDTVQDEPDSLETSDTDPVVSNDLSECGDELTDPLATDDSYGVRPGSTVMLSVLDNDSSQTCGVLTVGDFTNVSEEFGTVKPVYDGRALQLQVSETASGQATFGYTVTDGRATTTPAEANVTITVIDEGTQQAPVQVRTSAVRAEQGGLTRHNVLADFIDPDGDKLWIVGASADESLALTVDVDGMLAIRPNGTSLGQHSVTVTVTDGERAVEGEFNVEVVSAASVPPTLGPLHASGLTDSPVTLSPLDTVLSRGADPIRLSSVSEVPGVSVQTNLAAGTFSVTAQAPGSYLIPFAVASETQEVAGLARVDITAPTEASGALVATHDFLYLQASGQGTINPLTNDVFPAGATAMVLSVEAPETSGLTVTTNGYHVVTARSARALAEPVELTYQITDGVALTNGTITVVPLPVATSDLPPSVTDVNVRVRTGGVVTIPALANVVEPEGQEVYLDTLPVTEPTDGTLYITTSQVRYLAPEEPGTYQGAIAVLDASGNSVAMNITIDVHPADAARKGPPRPQDLTARVFAGEQIRIEVPLTGIDDDGDGIMLDGLATAPELGIITDIGSTWLEFEALPDAQGTDTFEYAVQDWTGQRVRATITVVVASRPTNAASLTAVDDLVSLRPGQTVLVPVLDNDSDALGEMPELAEELEIDEPTVIATAQDGAILVQAPQTETTANLVYSVTTPSGGRDQAILTIEVSEEAPVLAPVAADISVRPVDTIGLNAAEVEVLSVARNPTGSVGDLEVTIPDEFAEVARVLASGAVVVNLGETSRTIPYLLTDPRATELAGVGFITVPELGNYPPLLRDRTDPLTVVSGDELQFDLSDYVRVAPGKEATITDAETAQATRSDGSEVVVDPTTIRFVSEPGYAGPASVSVEVADGPADAETTRTSFLTFPITVLAPEAYPPTFSETTIDVGVGDRALTVDLLTLTSSVADRSGTPQRYSFDLAGDIPSGFDVTLDGSRLTISVPVDTPAGTRGTLPIAIGYGGAEPVPARVQLRAVATTRPLPRVQNTALEARAGQTVSVSVLNGAYNPFPDTALQVVDATILSGQGTISISGAQVNVKPADDIAQVITARFQVQDATDDPARIVEGTVTVNVLGPPDQPAAPVAVAEDGAVDLTISPPAHNGSPITEYRITTHPGGNVTTCRSTACTVGGLTNGAEYTFTVVAINAIGASPPSAASVAVRPDVVPEAPTGLTANRGPRQLTLSWNAAQTRGSEVLTYLVELSPGGIQVEVSGGTLSTTVSGLTNGTEYTARVHAINAKGAGPWSGSVQGIPADVPAVPGLPQVPNQHRPDGGSGLDISWSPVDGNGDPVTRYEVKVVGPEGPRTFDATGTSVSVSATLGSEYSIRIRAWNTIGASAWGPEAIARVWASPTEPTSLTLAVVQGRPYNNGQVNATWAAPSSTGGSGINIVGYDVTWTTPHGQSTERVTGTSASLTGLAGGATISVQVRAVNSQNAIGPPATSAAVGVTTQPQVLSLQIVRQSGANNWQVSWQAESGGTPMDSYYIKFNDSAPYIDSPVYQDRWEGTLNLPSGLNTVSIRVHNSNGWSEWVRIDFQA
ncbi:MAG: fibronectin type III domain-containing protein [Beutenbergiaceae bacterium]